jgi:hypothetical protein
MSPDRLDDLRKQARERSTRDRSEREERGGGGPEPGDLFVLPETAGLPVEWAVLDRHPLNPGLLLAVPADANPLAGSADVEVPESEPGGPLNLRCRFGVWIEMGVFDPERRTGALAPAAVEEARRKRKELEWGEPSASPLAWEVDADPEYRDWLADTAAPARAALEARRFTSKRPKPGGSMLAFPGSWVRLLAAALLAVCVGLSVWVAYLARTVDELSKPAFGVPFGDVTLGHEPRSGSNETVIRLPPEASRFVVYLAFDPGIEAEVANVEIVGPDGKVLSRSGPIKLPSGERMIILPHREGRYHVRLWEGAGPGGALLEEVVLVVDTAEAPEAD